MTRRAKGLALATSAVIATLAVVWIVHASAPAAATHERPGRGGAAMPVVAVAAKKDDIKVTLDALGTVTPLATVTVKSQVNGQ
ncbi:MAG: hypothetical protein JWR16_2311, partial [Nevskia sp.]|nr:hypothetical protein [Nevskia sp.]